MKKILAIIAVLIFIILFAYNPLNVDEIEKEPDKDSCIKMDSGKTFCEVGTISVESGGIKETLYDVQ